MGRWSPFFEGEVRELISLSSHFKFCTSCTVSWVARERPCGRGSSCDILGMIQLSKIK